MVSTEIEEAASVIVVAAIIVASAVAFVLERRHGDDSKAHPNSDSATDTMVGG
jgi:hypothetical protein